MTWETVRLGIPIRSHVAINPIKTAPRDYHREDTSASNRIAIATRWPPGVALATRHIGPRRRPVNAGREGYIDGLEGTTMHGTSSIRGLGALAFLVAAATPCGAADEPLRLDRKAVQGIPQHGL